MLENRNSNITKSLSHIIKAFSDFRLVAQIREENPFNTMDKFHPSLTPNVPTNFLGNFTEVLWIIYQPEGANNCR